MACGWPGRWQTMIRDSMFPGVPGARMRGLKIKLNPASQCRHITRRTRRARLDRATDSGLFSRKPEPLQCGPYPWRPRIAIAEELRGNFKNPFFVFSRFRKEVFTKLPRNRFPRQRSWGKSAGRHQTSELWTMERSIITTDPCRMAGLIP